MTDYRDLSRLPKDHDYWAELEERLVRDLGQVLRDREGPRRAWWAPLAARASMLGALAAAAALAALFVLPPRAAERQPTVAGLLRLAGDDPALVALLAGAEPPQLTTLLAERWRERNR